MSVTLIQYPRVFEYDGSTYEDPDPRMAPERVVSFLALGIRRLANAGIVSKGIFNGSNRYEIVKVVGSKG
jgi:PRTRC genetic system protein C